VPEHPADSSRRSRRAPGPLRRWWQSVHSSFWFVPTLAILVATALAVALIIVDRVLQDTGFVWTYAGGPETTTATLTTIASSMITFTGLVFSILIVALQLTSSQFSPRALRSFLRDRRPQAALGVFVATFTYAFAALTAVRFATDEAEPFVPSLTVTVAFVLVAVSVLFFVQLIHHTAQSLRVVSIIVRIAGETRAVLDELYPPDAVQPHPPAPVGPVHEVRARAAGVVADADLGSLARVADRLDAHIEVVPHVGTFVCRGEALLRIHGGRPCDDEAELLRHVPLEQEPTIVRDVGFGLRQLVDIAERALSPGINDPTTAVQCLDRIHDLLRDLTSRPIPTVRVGAVDGRPLAWQPAPSYHDLLHLALDEIRHWGATSMQVHRRLHRLLDDLMQVNDDPDRHLDLFEQQRLLAARRHDLPEVELAQLGRHG
jgi:uncharacterized membrane protein